MLLEGDITIYGTVASVVALDKRGMKYRVTFLRDGEPRTKDFAKRAALQIAE
jgi:hypothetical protein